MSRKLVLIKDLISEISMGPFGSDIKVDNFVDEGVPVLNGSNLSGVALVDGFSNYVTVEKADSLKKANAKKGDIVITHRGTLGQISYIPESSLFDRYIISQSQFRVRLKSDLVNPIYFAYYFHTREGQKRLLSFKSHVGVPALAQATTNFRQLEFPIIPIKDQNKIAKVLFDIDAKIELNNKINVELEAMAKLIYDYWFVQFDFPDENGKPYKSSGGKMVWNEELKREIPKGWNIKELSDIANITMGQSPPGNSYNEENIGTVFYQGCTDFGKRFPTIRKYTTQPTRFAKQGDILLSVRAPVGTINISKEDCCIGRGLASLNSKDNHITYLYGVMINLKQIFDRRNVDGTTFGSITKDDLFSLKVIQPTKDILEQFHTLLNPSFEKQNMNELENIQLSKLRDWLLPMLMNGQVTISENNTVAKVDRSETISDHYQQRKALAIYILSQSSIDISLGKVKFEKLLHLSEYHVVREQLNQQYIQYAAGPLDIAFTYNFFKEAEAEGIISFQSHGSLQRIVVNTEAIKDVAFNLGEEVRLKINALIKEFMGSNYEKPEIISTLYAVWNNRIIRNEMITDELLKQDFLAWDEQKAKYKDQLDRNLNWMRNKGYVPDGWGEVIEEKKTKKKN